MKSGWRKAASLLSDSDLWPYVYRLLPWYRQHRPAKRHEPPYLRNLQVTSSIPQWPGTIALLRFGDRPLRREDWELPLASTKILACENLRLPWKQAFFDPEDGNALQRFAWLLPWVVLRATEQAAADQSWHLIAEAIKDWLACPNQPPYAWQPYTMAERMMNWTIAALALGRDIRGEKYLATALAEHADRLTRDLEYYGEFFTGNHLSNNGRALYIVGLIIGDGIAAFRGRTILLEEAQRLFREPWFLREGSSHYQFLVARNYIESLWAAQIAGDDKTGNALFPHVAALVEGCRFFLVFRPENDTPAIPLIGDISPDCTPEWLLGVPDVGAKLTGNCRKPVWNDSSGWHTLFQNVMPTSDQREPSPVAPIVSDEWAKVEQLGWTIFTHSNPSGTPLGHAHQDTGAIVLFKEGLPIILDTGRLHYVDDEVGRWGRTAGAHSILTVDALDPAPMWHWLYPPEALKQITGGPPRIELSPLHLTVSHSGFRRGSDVAQYKRSVRVLTSRELEITDELQGEGRTRARLIFHIHGRCSIQKGQRVSAIASWFRLETVSLEDVHHCYGFTDGTPRSTFGWACKAYGSATPITSLIVEGLIPLPWRATTVVQVEL
jgi:hypothetical protein